MRRSAGQISRDAFREAAARQAGDILKMTTAPWKRCCGAIAMIVAGALGVIVALAWGYVLWLADDMDMGGMDMTGFRMIPAGMGIMLPANAPWRAIEFAYVFAMWAVMMVGMMAPSAAPMILMYARVGRQAKADGQAVRRDRLVRRRLFPGLDRLFAGSDLGQWAIERAALLDSEMASASNMLGGIVLIAAGVYQWTPLKDVCLPNARRRSSSLMRHGGFRGDVPGCLLLGLRHGALLRRLLLGADGAFVCRRGDERALDRRCSLCSFCWRKSSRPAVMIARIAGCHLLAGGVWMLLQHP